MVEAGGVLTISSASIADRHVQQCVVCSTPLTVNRYCTESTHSAI